MKRCLRSWEWRLPLTPRVQVVSGSWAASNQRHNSTGWLRRLPQAILLSIAAPMVLSKGPAEAMAGVVTVLVASRTRHLLLPISAGVIAVWVLRSVL